jgi:hypothetical protein
MREGKFAVRTWTILVWNELDSPTKFRKCHWGVSTPYLLSHPTVLKDINDAFATEVVKGTDALET